MSDALNAAILGQTHHMNADELVGLAMAIADRANLVRKPEQGNRAFTFVKTYYDCTFAHPVFLQDPLPTNKEAQGMGFEVSVVSAAGTDAGRANLRDVVTNCVGHPTGLIRFGDGDTLMASFDSDKRAWRLFPD